MSHAAKIIMLSGGPGSGKSTLAAELFAAMKHQNMNVELVTEYAKWKVWQGVPFPLDPVTVWARQRDFLERIRPQVDYIVTDTNPLLAVAFAIHENTLDGDLLECFRELALEQHNAWDTFDVYVRRVKPFHEAGRFQNEQQARELDELQRGLLADDGIHVYEIDGIPGASRYLLDEIRKFERDSNVQNGDRT